jgi:3',5'-cyclic AMP phosphodiesterase CpdA
VVVNESGAVIDAVFDWLLAHGDTDLVLIAGDLCTGGDRAHHDLLIPKLRRLQAGGKRVFVITASHDYYKFGHEDEDGPREDMVYRDQLYGLYEEFGFSAACSRYENDPLSYAAQIAPGCRLLCLNTDGDKGEDPGLWDWAEAQIAEARAAGELVLAMHHYPVLPPSPVYPLLDAGVFGRSLGLRERLADAGLRFVFTGHTHMQNISYMDTPAGNRLYEINTGSAVGFDAPIRTVAIDGESMAVTTSSIDHFDWDLQGKSVSQYLKDSFDRMLDGIFEAMGHDVERMLDILNGEFRVDKEGLLRHKRLLAAGGKFLYKLTLGGAGRLLCCKVPREVRAMRVKDLIMEAVRNIYAGDEPYSTDTPIGAAVDAVMGRVETLARPFLKKADLPFESLRGFVMSLVYDGGLPDNNAVLAMEE